MHHASFGGAADINTVAGPHITLYTNAKRDGGIMEMKIAIYLYAVRDVQMAEDVHIQIHVTVQVQQRDHSVVHLLAHISGLATQVNATTRISVGVNTGLRNVLAQTGAYNLMTQ